MKRTLVLVLFFVCYSVEADFNLNSEIIKGLKTFNINATFPDNFTVRVPSFRRVECEGNFSRELMNILDHLIVQGDTTKLDKLKMNVKKWVENGQQAPQTCPMNETKFRKVSYVFTRYKQFISRLNSTKTTKQPSVN